MSNRVDRVEFDVLLRAQTGDGERPVDVKTVSARRPPAETIERCRQWLEGQGIICHPTAFGLACSAPRPLFESVFGVEVIETDGGPGRPPVEMSGPAQVPEAIAETVEQITIGAAPELF